MGSYKKEKNEGNQDGVKKIGKTCIVCLLSFAVSMAGGLILGWWNYKHHPTNSQLWMVPFGLILLVTPIFVWLTVFVSDICTNSVADNVPRTTSEPAAADSVNNDVETGLKISVHL